MAKWVQHKSGVGEKWEVFLELDTCLKVRAKEDFYFLPKSEYIECDPPERWVDVTEKCMVSQDGAVYHNGHFTCPSNGYRLRKMQLYRCDGDSMCRTSYKEQWAFVVERKES